MEDGLALKRLDELALRAARTGRTQYTRFLEPSMMNAANAAAGRQGASCRLWGGYADAERVMAAFYVDVPPEDSEYPFRIMRITWNGRFDSPAHRDLLGAALGLGIEREAIGDIAMGLWRGTACACMFVERELADYIAANMVMAGRIPVNAMAVDELCALTPPEGRELRVTVQSPRLDAVVAAGCGLSRSDAQRLVSAGLVKLNHLPNTRGDAKVGPGDLISVRGYGRVKVTADLGQSRRGRQALMLFKYGK